jgi:hypothetical protein
MSIRDEESGTERSRLLLSQKRGGEEEQKVEGPSSPFERAASTAQFRPYASFASRSGSSRSGADARSCCGCCAATRASALWCAAAAAALAAAAFFAYLRWWRRPR